MRKITVLALLGAPLAALALCSSPAPEAPEPAQQTTTWRDSALLAVKIAAPWSGGSGVPVACKPTWNGQWDVYFLTCKHVVNQDTDLTLWHVQSPEQYYGAPMFVSQHPTLDASLVRVTVDFPVPVVELRLDHPEVGEQVWTTGYPAINNRVITTGYIGDFERSSAAVFPGNSGGPVVDYRGRLVGIVTAIGVTRQAYILQDTYFQSSEPIEPWLRLFL